MNDLLYMKPYEIIEHTADVGIKATGATLKELFENAAKGMFGIITGEKEHKSTNAKEHPDRQASGAGKKIQIEKEVEGIEELLVNWLSELLYIFNKEEILFSKFKVLELNNSRIIGEAQGAKAQTKDIQTEIKAVTFHNLKIQETPQGFTCSIIFDV